MQNLVQQILILILMLTAAAGRLAGLHAQNGTRATVTLPDSIGLRFDRERAQQPVSYGKDGEFKAPDYDYFIDLLTTNIEANDHIDERIYTHSEKEQWVSTYLQRARHISELSQWNQDAIAYFLPHLWEDSVPQGFEPHLFNHLVHSRLADDDFIYEEILSRLNTVFENVKDRSEADMSRFLTNKYELAITSHVTSLSGESKAMAETYKHLRDIADHYVPGRDVPASEVNTTVYFLSCNYLLNYREFIKYGYMTDIEAIDFRHQVERALADTIITRSLTDEVRQRTRQAIASQELGILRNIYMPDTTHRYDRVRDSLQIVYISRYDQQPQLEQRLSANEKRRLAIMRYRSGRLSALDALKVCEATKVRIDTEKTDTISIPQLRSQLNCILDCIYCIDVADLPFAQKQSRVRAYRNEIFQLLAMLNYSHRMPDLITTLSNVATYPRLHKYLYTSERKQVLETLLFFSQPFTRAHSETVTRLAVVILKGVIKYQPELLLGMRGYTKVSQLQRHPEELISFFTDAARYHDLGKTRMPDIIRNDTRKLTDHEFAIIKLHPELALNFLKVDSSLMELKDIVLGHHRWYDGKGGYPAYFDNTKSPYRVLIDILTLADCIEAATARLGRNYRKNKTYDDVYKEFQDQAGTRYNPVLVQFLADHQDIADQLRVISAKGWEDIYYEIFNANSNPADLMTPQTSTPQPLSHHDYMSMAIDEARSGIRQGHGGPFGTVIVKDGKVIASGHNRVLVDHDPTAHGEMTAIRKAGTVLGTHDLSGCTLYTTGEPCHMCLCAILWANIDKVYYGCTIADNGRIGFRDDKFNDIFGGRDQLGDLLTELDRAQCLSLFDEYNAMQHEGY